jgi:UDP-4-amino-4,6-dideoxy-N-acetyl-beta-L-altrosamine transaminase
LNDRRIIPYGKQHITEEDIQAVAATLRSDYLTQGPKVAEFENALAEYTGAKYAVCFSNGTAALHGAYYSAGLGKNDKFITTPMTFAATANAGLYLGAVPIFCDVELDTGNIDASKLDDVSDSVKLIAPVHYAGLPCEMESIKAFADKKGAVIVEDACHALGAEYKGTRIGSCAYSDMTVFSFHPVKHIATGEGGAVLTNNKDYYNKLKLFRSHGITKENHISTPHGGWYMEMQELGYNYRLTDIQCTLGIGQLKRSEANLERRRNIASLYDKAFREIKDIETPKYYIDRLHAYHLYPIKINNRKAVYEALHKKNIYAQVHYIPVYMHPYYRQNGYSELCLRNAEQFYSHELSIPMFPSLTDEEVDYVIRNLIEAVRECASE